MKLCIKKILTTVVFTAFFGMINVANAGLIKRTDNLIYDDVSDVTWIADMKYSIVTSGGNGKMKWQAGMDWAANLAGPDGFGFSEWRLPTLAESVSLKASYVDHAGWFQNRNEWSRIWTSTEHPSNVNKALHFTVKGGSGNENITSSLFVWAVTTGDIAGIATEVPEPATLAIFSLALAGLAYRRRTAKMPK